MSSLFRLVTTALFALPLALLAQLNGIYTVDPAGGGNYTTISAAMWDLTNLGVSGPVTVRIMPGVYPEKLMVLPIPGSSVSRPVWFESTTLDSTSVTVGPAPDGTITVHLIDAVHVGFRSLTILAATSGIEGFYTGALKVQNCVVRGDGGAAGQHGIWLHDSPNPTVRQCRIVDVNEGITLSACTNVTIRQNTVLSGCHGIAATGGSNITFDANVCQSSGGCSSPFATQCTMNIVGATGSQRVTANTIINSGGGICLQLDNITSQAADRTRVVNNMLVQTAIGQATVATPCDLRYCNYVDVYHNSMITTGARSDVTFTMGGNLRVKGNIFSTTTGPALNVQGTTALTCDYNMYQVTGAYVALVGTSYRTFSMWQAVGGQDLNGLQADPLFVSSTDLHLTNASPGQNRVPLNLNVNVDIDGGNRPMPINTLADMGCDERLQLLVPLHAMQAIPASDVIEQAIVYPVPADGEVRLALPGEQPLLYALYTMDGRLVSSGSIGADRRLQVAAIPEGAYVLHLVQPDVKVRLVVRH
jgi:parallel beta-helix repeat protein